MRCPEGLLFVCRKCFYPDADFNHIVSCQKLTIEQTEHFRQKFEEGERKIKQRNETILERLRTRRSLKLQFHLLCVEEAVLKRRIKKRREESQRLQ